MALIILDNLSHGAVKITLNDPDALNAMSEQMAVEFRDVVMSLQPRHREIRSIVITGAGRAFSAGGDLAMLEAKQQLSSDKNKELMLDFYDSFLSILNLDIPIIAALNGHAVGAGLCLALACDIRVATEQAKLGVTFTKLGLHPGMGGTFFLPRVVGRALATELMITGRMIDAAEGLRIGLLSRVCKADELTSVVEGITKEIASSGHLAVGQVLETLRRDQSELQNALEREAVCQAVNYASAEFKEGLAAVKEKRPARF